MFRLTHPVCAFAALLVLASTGCSLLPPGAVPQPFQAAALAPADTWFLSTLSLRPSVGQIANLAALSDIFSSQPGLDAALNTMGSSVPERPIDFEKDVLPLLDGEIAFAASGDLMSSFSSASGPSVVTLLHSPDPDRLLRVLLPTIPPPQPTSTAASTLYPLPDGRTVASSYKQWAILATSRDLLDDTLKRIDGGPGGLAQQPRFQSVLARLPAERFGYTYVDTAPIVQALISAGVGSGGLTSPFPGGPFLGLAGESEGLSPEEFLAAAAGQIATSITALPQAFEFRVEMTLDQPRATANPVAGDALAAFRRLPSNTLGAWASALPPITETQDLLLNELLARAGLTDQPGTEFHLSRWLGRELAVGAAPGDIGRFGSSATLPDVFLVASVTDVAAARRDIDTLQALLPAKSVQAIDVAGLPMSYFSPAPGQDITYGVANSWLYGILGDAEAVLRAPATGGLNSNPRFQMIQAALVTNGSNTFVDLDAIRQLAEGSMRTSDRTRYDGMVKPFVTPIRAFGGGSAIDATTGDIHGHFLLAVRR